MIRADASHVIGHGHIMRCLTLAESLQSHAVITFICAELNGHLIDLVKQRGYEVIILKVSKILDSSEIGDQATPYSHWLPWSENTDASLTTNAILANQQGKRQPLDWLIIDHYALSKSWELKLNKYSNKIMVIDDLTIRQHHCDLFLNQTPVQVNIEQSDIVPTDCCSLIGCQYALLRSEFRRWQNGVPKRRAGLNSVKNILIAPGGVDNQNITLQLLKLIEEIGVDELIEIDVVLGSDAPHLATLQEYTGERTRNIQIHSGINNIDEYMWQADIAIGAAGGTSWERCAMGLPTLLIVYAENQKDNATVLIEHRCAKLLGDIRDYDLDEWGNTLGLAINDIDWLKLAAKNAHELCDSVGVGRVVEFLLKLSK